jgi:hypothetical protein
MVVGILSNFSDTAIDSSLSVLFFEQPQPDFLNGFVYILVILLATNGCSCYSDTNMRSYINYFLDFAA